MGSRDRAPRFPSNPGPTYSLPASTFMAPLPLNTNCTQVPTKLCAICSAAPQQILYSQGTLNPSSKPCPKVTFPAPTQSTGKAPSPLCLSCAWCSHDILHAVLLLSGANSVYLLDHKLLKGHVHIPSFLPRSQHS